MNRLARLFRKRDELYADAFSRRLCRVIDAITLQSSIRYGTRGKKLPA